MRPGDSVWFKATGTYTDGTTADFTLDVTWNSSAPTTVSIQSNGLALLLGASGADITASMSGITSPVVTISIGPPSSTTSVSTTTATTTTPTTTAITTTTTTQTAAKKLVSIAITPGPVIKLRPGDNVWLKATGTYSDGSTADITMQVTWTSSAPTTVSIQQNGLATLMSANGADITASMSGITSPVVTVSI